MLIRKEHTDEGGLLAIWEMEESREELLSRFPEHLRAEAIEYINSVRSERRSIEWLSTRAMVFILLGKDKSVQNYPDGKPYLADHSYHISISHTRRYAALHIHASRPVGVDIETRSDRVKKIANKLISEKVYIDPANKVVHQLLHWSAKESLYKLLNQQGVDFKQHLLIHPFTPSTYGTMTATEAKTGNDITYSLKYEVNDQYILTWVTGTAD